jgi:hypothetical protein
VLQVLAGAGVGGQVGHALDLAGDQPEVHHAGRQGLHRVVVEGVCDPAAQHLVSVDEPPQQLPVRRFS